MWLVPFGKVFFLWFPTFLGYGILTTLPEDPCPQCTQMKGPPPSGYLPNIYVPSPHYRAMVEKQKQQKQ